PGISSSRRAGVIEHLRPVENLIAVSLLGQEQLPMVGKVLFAGVAADERVKMGHLAAALGSQDAPQTLRLLLPRTERARYRDQDVGVGQVQREVADLRQDQRTHLAGAELAIQILAVGAARLPGDERDVEALAQLPQLLQILSDDEHAAIGVAVQQTGDDV